MPLPSFGQLVFLVAATLAVLGGFMMIISKTAVHSALWLILTFFQLAVMYVMLGAEFLAALQVLVYTGAILVLFLFVIMLLNLREGPQIASVHRIQIMAAWPVGLILAAEVVAGILSGWATQAPQAHVGDISGGTTTVWSTTQVAAVGGNVMAIGQTLYTQFLFPFEVASLILLMAVIGAIVLARKEEPAEVEEVLPALGISLGRRSVSDSPQEAQLEKKLLPALGVRYAPDSRAEDSEVPIVDQPSGVGAGTTSGVEMERPASSGNGSKGNGR